MWKFVSRRSFPSFHYTTCKWKFDHYTPSPWERYWQENIDKFESKVCRVLAEPEQAKKSMAVLRRIMELQQSVFDASSVSPVDSYLSELHYHLHCANESHPRLHISHKIEPLVGLIRDPLTICSKLSTIPSNLYLEGEYAVQSKRFILLGPSAPTNAVSFYRSPIPSWLSHTLENRRTPQIILFDIGSSYFNSVDGAQLGPHIGSRWFYEYFKHQSIRLDRIIAFEYTPLTPRIAWDQLPWDVIPIYTLINVGVEEKGKFNPWQILQAIAEPHDYVLVKLDIDADAIENALMHQILANPKLRGLIDEMFYEMHVTVADMHQYWGTFRNTSLADVYELFTKMRSIGIRMHSWP